VESIEDIEVLFSDIELASSNLWHTKTIPSIDNSRILLSRDSSGDYCLFIKGRSESFGQLPSLANIEHRDDAIDAQTGENFPALKLHAPKFVQGNAAVAHIAHEIVRCLGEDPDVDNASLIQRVNWILEVLGHKDAPMGEPRQRGLVAELLLLSQLLQRGREYGVSPEGILDKWHGPTGGRRDFSGSQIAIEVKATAATTRRHRIDSLAQLESDELETVFIFSVGLRHDQSFSKCLTDYAHDISVQLVGLDGNPLLEAREKFEAKLSACGYDRTHDILYRSAPGILQSANLPPRLFRVSDLDRLRLTSFKNDALPLMVVNVSYDLELSTAPDIFDSMIIG